MECILKIFDAYANSIIVFASLVTMATTLIYAGLTYLLLSQSKKQHEWNSRPKIAVTLEPDAVNRNFMNIVISNYGNSPATELKFEVSSDYTIINTLKLRDLNLFKNGLAVFGAGQRISAFVGHMNDDGKADSNFEISYSYKFQDRLYNDKVILDFSAFKGLLFVGD